jgi:hypothetical protein
MFRRIIANPKIIPVVLVLQIIPLILFPAASYSSSSQEWWLPAVLTVLAIIAVIDLFINRSSVTAWAWQLIAFAQGFNLISRMLMLFPHLTANVGGVQKFNAVYVILTVVAMGLSVLMLWYVELPEVRVGLLKESAS